MKRLEQYDTFAIPAACIYYDSDFNCRGEFALQSVADLAKSIGERGLEFPVVVRPAADAGGRIPAGYDWGLIAGFRRFTSTTQFLKWMEIPAMVRRGLTEHQVRLLNFTENLERKDLSPLEEARAITRLYPNTMSTASIARELKRDPQWVSKRLLILRMPPEVQELMHARRITLLDLNEIVSKQPTPELQIKSAMILAAKRTPPGRRRHAVMDGKKLERTFRRRRNKREINDKIEFAMSMGITDGLGLRMGAWCAGHVSDDEIDEEIWNEVVMRKQRKA